MRLLIGLAGLASVLIAGAPAPGGPEHPKIPPAAVATTAIPGWMMQTSAQVGSDAAVSQPGFDTAGWLPVKARSTVYAGLLANGRYADPFYSTNMASVPAAQFKVPWWYRADIQVPADRNHTSLDFSGILSASDVWVNGTKVATTAGVYPEQNVDVTSLVKPGTNSIAFKVQPNDPDKNLTMGWIDWAETPPDQNMGIVRDVVVHRTGSVALSNAHVVTTLNSDRSHADVVVKADARNTTGAAVTTTVSGTAAGKAISTSVTLGANQTRTVTFPAIGLDHPALWWPAGMGAPTLNDLDLSATVNQAVSDTAHERFGIRSVASALNAAGARTYTINGRPLLIKGGGWAPDLFLRWDTQYAADRLQYALDLGLNTIRLEGHIEPNEFFDLADQMGVLTLPGWECCDKWQSISKWTDADYAVAKASAVSEGARLRNHPSVISFLIGSDESPTAKAETNYLEALHSVDWPDPIVTSAADTSSPQLGRSGMKMTGPYDWVPPAYWYDTAHGDSGGAWGFNSETSAGPDIPTLDTLNRMMTPSELNTLWTNPSAAEYHRSNSDTFGNLKLYGDALTARYGKATSLTDFDKKAQLAQYENIRAQYEAYGRNFPSATGVIYWMYNSPWTSLHWQLFDRYLDQGGSYFGAHEANKALHVQYSYDNKQISVVNRNHDPVSGLGVKVDLFDVEGVPKYSASKSGVTVGGDGAHATPLTLPAVRGLPSTYLARLILTDAAGHEIDRNVYWLSTRSDVMDWSNNDWYYVPTTSYADLTGLQSMSSSAVQTLPYSVQQGANTVTTVVLRNIGSGTAPALFTDAHIVDVNGTPVLPVRWSDNEVTLWPGESVTLTATYRTADLHGSAPSVRVSGWNIGTTTVGAGSTVPPPGGH
ncbi:glycosyl hydrolase 2 galactose-binding domain-containing protein [Actinoplanes sp. NPDC051343]|uniref:glycoside hydrolase family 2 protein n=1 Tax=Actinoplanes sp. NPDC051343 TaxID=3363906 RepID=UPI0037A6A74F